MAGPVSFLLGLPLAPVKGVVRLAEIIQEQAEQEYYGSESLRAELEEIAHKRAAGQISEEEERRVMTAVTARATGRDPDDMVRPTGERPAEEEEQPYGEDR